MSTTAAAYSGDETAITPPVLIELVKDIVKVSAGVNGSEFKRDCNDLVRRISLLAHLFEEIRDLKSVDCGGVEYGEGSRWFSDLVFALQAAKGLLIVAASFGSAASSVSFNLWKC